jgi:hypothetical protein
MNDQLEEFEHFKIRKDNSGDIQNVINCIFEDKSGDIWIGTFGSGLVKYISKTGQYINYSQKDGLSGNYINAITEDTSSRIWISTCNGLDMLDPVRETIYNTDIELEQPDNDLLSNCVTRQNGKYAFFARNHIVEIAPDFYPVSSFPGPLLLSSFKIFDKEISFLDTIHQKPIPLAYNQNFFSFEYSILKLNPEGHVFYAYKLEGFDPNWNFSRDRGLAIYTNVPPGDYVFMAKAMDQTGNWKYYLNPVHVIIEPPFWKTWWFIIFIFTLIICSFYFLFRYRLDQIHKFYQLRSDISKDLHDQIGATLTSISFLSEVAKKQSGETPVLSRTLEKIGQYSRSMITEMNDIVWVINPLNDTFEKIVDRIQDFALELAVSKGMRFSMITDQTLLSSPLTMKQRKNLYLILKESINNAVKHSGCTELIVTMKKENGRLCIEIRDNGKGIPANVVDSPGNGLRNMRQRSKEIDINFRMHSEPGNGTLLYFEMPITQNAY